MATAPPRKRQPRLPIEVRRQQVLDAALSIITEDGYAAVSMEAIARRVDVAKPVVYNAFAGLDALLHALLELRFSTRQFHEDNLPACSFYGSDCVLRKMLADGVFRIKGENQRNVILCRLGKRRQPNLFAQENEGFTAEGKK